MQSEIGMPNQFGAVRNPYPGEVQFFKTNPHVAGMAAEDDMVVLNPFRNFKQAELDSVIRNERVRLLIRKKRIPPPNFLISNAQKQALAGYPGGHEDLLATVAARIAAGDPSAVHATDQQNAYVNTLILPQLKQLGW